MQDAPHPIASRPTTIPRSPICSAPRINLPRSGYTTPYRWAHYVEAPFQPLKKPLSQSRVTIITTQRRRSGEGRSGPGCPV